MFKNLIKKIIIHTHPNYYLKIRSQRSGYFEREVEFLDTFCDKSKIALDIGASLGTYSYLMLQHSKKVIAIEPLKEKCQKLDYLFRNLENFEVLNIAVSDKIDEKQIRVPLGDTGRSTIENSNNLTRC